MTDLHQIWGKSSRNEQSSWHPLLYHMLDAAAVTQTLWDHSLAESFKSDISKNFCIPETEGGKLIAFWVSLHDIGKAGPEFQKKNSERMQHLASKGYSFQTQQTLPSGFHGTATSIILRRIFKDTEPNLSRNFRDGLAFALGGHHGEIPRDSEINDASIQKIHVGDDLWQSLQNSLYSCLKNTINPVDPKCLPGKLEELNPLLLLLVGLSTTSDWIASNEDLFPFQSKRIEPSQYFEATKIKAQKALNGLGWIGWNAHHENLSFHELFPLIKPNPMQETVIRLTGRLKSPFLAIIEAQTGSGKTEAALYLADSVIQRDHKTGIYIAMPTQATSNQMFSRFKKFLSCRYPDDEINLHLVHGKALIGITENQFNPTSIWSNDGEAEGNIHSQSWFLPRKRTLLAPFGVGTVDQTFLSVLRSRFFFLRLFGLSHKVLIFDEVHAYDIYMTEIFKTLLHWLHAVKTSVIILTATLPEETRNELLDAYTSKAHKIEQKTFPRISIANDEIAEIHNAGETKSRKIKLTWIDKNPQSIISNLEKRIKNGGCVAVICNTVKRAQDVFDAINKAFLDETHTILLFHSHYPYCWRKEIEDNVISMFGKEPSKRPQKAILVATQLIEQSLDLDFDLLITDLAPIDLIIQRIGRLHRHERFVKRPLPIQEPECIISAYKDVNETLNQGGDRYIYEPYILAKTMEVLSKREHLTLPLETDDLINGVYTNIVEPGILLSEARIKMKHKEEVSRVNAHNYLIPQRHNDFIGMLPTFFGDDLGSLSKRVLTAPTREIEPSIQIVCLEKGNDGIHFLGDDSFIDLEGELSSIQIQKCLLSEVTINNKMVIANILNGKMKIPEGFRSSSSLRWHFPILFSNGIYETDVFRMELNREIGLLITEK